tara:strand:- start:1191 stop:2882 length:1692 start_codon:yes stop_codon:yes gene_type:complete
MALINQNSIIGVTSITSPSASNVLTVHTNDTTERLRVSTSGVSFSGTNASLDTSGNISAVDGTFSGNVSVGGVLTYEDVTNIDAIGVVTARSGIHVTGGNVGIGTDNPTSDLQVVSYGDHGKIRVESSGNGNRAGVEFFRESSAGTGKGAAGIWVESETGNSTGELRFGTANNASLQSFNTKMILDINGRLGIGTDNLSSNLTIAEDHVSTNAELAINYTGSGNRTSAIRFQRGGTNYGYIAGAGFMLTTGAQDDLAIAPVSGKNLLFGIGNSEKLRITSSGNIGIGTTNPGSKLAVHGSITESTDGVTYYPVVTQQDVGLDQNQIPLNQNLGGMAYMDTSNYEQVFEIPATDVTSYFKEGTENIYIGMEGHAPSSVAWPSGSLNQIDVWEIDFQLTYPNMTSGRNDLWMLMYYHNGSSITQATSVEWNNWVLARTSYAGTNTGWNQIQSASSTNWGKLANYMDAKLFSGKILFYRGGTNDFTGSNAGQRTGVMWRFNYTHGGVGSTLAFGSAHPTTPSPSQPLAGFTLNADPENAGTVDSNGNSQVFGGYIRQRGFRLQGNI